MPDDKNDYLYEEVESNPMAIHGLIAVAIGAMFLFMLEFLLRLKESFGAR